MTMPPVIDAHHHFWDAGQFEYPGLAETFQLLGPRYGPDELEPELRIEHTTGTVVVQLAPQIEETARLLALAEMVPWVRGVVGWVDLTAVDVAATIERLRTGPGGQMLVSVRYRVPNDDEPDWLCRPDVRRGLEAVEAAGLAFDLQVRSRELPAATDTCAALPHMRFVLDHLARPPIASGDLSAWGRALLPLGELDNVSAKISGLATEADWRTWSIDELRHPVELAVDTFGPGRLMLGSDWPVCLLAGSYSDVVDSVRYLLAELPEHEQAEIRGGTAARVYRLDTSGPPGALEMR